MDPFEGDQLVEVGSGCSKMVEILPLLMLVLGRGHENLREDRDQYVRVNWDNIYRGTCGTFNLMLLFGNKYYIYISSILFGYYSIP